jgi:hypothetical protein
MVLEHLLDHRRFEDLCRIGERSSKIDLPNYLTGRERRGRYSAERDDAAYNRRLPQEMNSGDIRGE